MIYSFAIPVSRIRWRSASRRPGSRFAEEGFYFGFIDRQEKKQTGKLASRRARIIPVGFGFPRRRPGGKRGFFNIL
jgi:hypothetical protein